MLLVQREWVQIIGYDSLKKKLKQNIKRKVFKLHIFGAKYKGESLQTQGHFPEEFQSEKEKEQHLSSPQEVDFILGLNETTAAKMSPDTYVLFETPHVDAYEVSTKEDILNCTSLDNIKDLRDSNTAT